MLHCFFLLLKSVEPSFSAFYSTDVNLLFLQPEVYSLHFLCERAFTFAINRTSCIKTNNQALLIFQNSLEIVNWWVFVKCEPKSSQLKEPKT